jgi:hypothetical protein
MAMLGNNMSTLGVSASRLDDTVDTWSLMLNWLPTTHEYGPLGAFGDFEHHDELATRLGVHFTHSTEDRQQQPGTDSIENTQIRLTDGNVIFTPNLFAPGVTVEKVRYQMASFDAGLKYRGYSLEGEYYRRWLSDFVGAGTAIIDDITDDGYQLQASAMIFPSVLQGLRGPFRGLRRPGRRLRAAPRLQLFSAADARSAVEWRVDDPRRRAAGLLGVSVPGGREWRRDPRQPRVQLLVR